MNFIFLDICHQLSAKCGENEAIYFYKYCLQDGVATSFDKYGYKQFTKYATLSYPSRCEPHL